MLVQICCSVDSEYFVRRLRAEYPNERILGYFYDPNIHPYSELLLRFTDVRRSCAHYGVEVICGPYELDAWFGVVKGLENEPEKGARCEKCFEMRFDATCKKAQEIGENTITTTLLMSPKKEHSQLVAAMEAACERYHLNFIAPDYRKNGGSNEQFALARTRQLYHQNYCGCMFALNAARERNFELMSDISRQILPNSPEHRLQIYERALELEKKGIKFEILQDKFMNFRLLYGKIAFDGVTQPSFFLYGSHFRRENINFRIEAPCEKYFTPKEQIKIFSLNFINSKFGTSYKNAQELIQNPPNLEIQAQWRRALTHSDGFCPVIIVDAITPGRVAIAAKSELFLDIKEILVTI